MWKVTCIRDNSELVLDIPTSRGALAHSAAAAAAAAVAAGGGGIGGVAFAHIIDPSLAVLVDNVVNNAWASVP